MKAYISISVADDDQTILSIFSKQMGTRITPVSGYHKFGQSNSELAFHEIKRANLFAGLIIKGGSELERVYNEWQYALNCQTPALLLVEEGVTLNQYPAIKKHPDVITFNRDSTDGLRKAIQKVRRRSDGASNRGDSAPFVRQAAWFIGGPVAETFLKILGTRSKVS